MSEVARSELGRSELEVSTPPEVAALATELTTLFNSLGIPQQQYAARIMIDKSTVSRFLKGRRVCTQEFIDRLFQELERHQRREVTREARQRIHQLRLDALKVTDPAAFKLEHLRDEVDRSHRAIRQLVRQQEALELLLDQREAAADDANRQLSELRSDWVQERLQNETHSSELARREGEFRDEQDRLRDEIADLRRQLQVLTRLKAEAEGRCAELEERIHQVEVELAERAEAASGSSFTLSPEEVVEEISVSYRDQRYHDAARTLTLAAAHFSESEIVALWGLLSRGLRRQFDAARLLDDAIRFRSAEFSANIVESILVVDSSDYLTQQNLAASLSTSKSSEEFFYLYDRWKSGGPLYGVLRSALVAWTELMGATSVFLWLRKLTEENDTPIRIRILHLFGLRSADEVVKLVSKCVEWGMDEDIRILVSRWYSSIPPEDRAHQRDVWREAASKCENSEKVSKIFRG